MILLTNGCSWTWGGGLGLDSAENDLIRNASTWPAHLAKLLNADEVVQLAAGCGSNQRIMRTTLDWILKQTPERLSNTLAIIQWTDPSRFEYYHSKDPLNYYENDPERWAKAKIDCVIDMFEENTEYNLKRVNTRLETYTEIEGLYKNIFECAALNDIFAKFGIKYYYWVYGGHVSDPPPHLLKILESYNWFEKSYQWQYEPVSEQDAHPSVQGHKDIATIIYKNLKEI